MRLRTAVALLAALTATAAFAPSAHAATKRVHWQQSAYVAYRFWSQIGFIPTNAILAKGSPAGTVRSGSTTYRVNWINALTSRLTTSESLKHASRYVRHSPVADGVYADRPLTTKEKRSWQVLIDLARDADVLVVDRENPACASGLTRAQARGIARGTITRWSAVTAPVAGQPDAIVRRVTGSDGFAEPRLGVQQKPGKAIVKPDGGLREVSGNRAVAAIVPWSRVRFNRAVCAVPIGGVTPSDQTVHALKYPEAYPITYVMHRKRRKDAEGRALVKGYVAYMKSAYVAKLLRNTGVLLAGDPPASGPGSAGGGGGAGAQPAPSSDYAGRAITTTQDDAAGTAALSGARLERSLDGATQRLAFEADHTLLALDTPAGAESCTRSQGGWTVLAGWRYPQNGGGVIARVRLFLAGTRDVTIEFPNDPAGTAYLDGQPYTSDPGLSNTCF